MTSFFCLVDVLVIRIFIVVIAVLLHRVIVARVLSLQPIAIIACTFLIVFFRRNIAFILGCFFQLSKRLFERLLNFSWNFHLWIVRLSPRSVRGNLHLFFLPTFVGQMLRDELFLRQIREFRHTHPERLPTFRVVLVHFQQIRLEDFLTLDRFRARFLDLRRFIFRTIVLVVRFHEFHKVLLVVHDRFLLLWLLLWLLLLLLLLFAALRVFRITTLNAPFCVF